MKIHIQDMISRLLSGGYLIIQEEAEDIFWIRWIHGGETAILAACPADDPSSFDLAGAKGIVRYIHDAVGVNCSVVSVYRFSVESLTR